MRRCWIVLWLYAHVFDTLSVLQVEWTAHDPGDGRVFYYNVKSGESTWDKPEGFKEKAVSKSSHPVSWEPVDGTDWMEVCHRPASSVCT